MTDGLITNEYIQALAQCPRLWVGYSGGLDSTVLLHVLMSEPRLANRLQAVHIHHGLSKHADAWQSHCQRFCEHWNIPFTAYAVACNRDANVEEQARNARYAVFASLLAKQDALLLAHHANDQAETILLQLLRGAGVDGLAAMSELRPFAAGVLIRPFLRHTRQALEAYAEQHRLEWVEDESNQDDALSRNYLRRHVLPLLQAKWPGFLGNFGRAARHCQQAKLNLEALAALDCPELSTVSATLNLSNLVRLSEARLSNVLRVWLKNHQVRLPSVAVLHRIIQDVILAPTDAVSVVLWEGVCIRRYQDVLYLLQTTDTPSITMPAVWTNFPAPLSLDNLGTLHASLSETGLYVPAGASIQVRFRQGGETLRWKGQTKSLKKLLQQWKIPPWERDLIPLIYIENRLASVVGWAISDDDYKENGSNVTRNTYQIVFSQISRS